MKTRAPQTEGDVLMKRYIIIILLLLSACSPKNVDFPKVFQDKKIQDFKESIAKLYAVSSKGEYYINAQKGKGYVKWDEQGVTIFVSRDFVANPNVPRAENFNKSIREFYQEVYSKSSEGKIYIQGTETYVRWDDNGLTIFVPKTEIGSALSKYSLPNGNHQALM